MRIRGRVVLRWGLGGLLSALFLVGVGFVVWASTPLGPADAALAALASDETVTVLQDRWITFEPATDATTGLVLYPGGRVDPRSYAPLARAIAARGHLVVIVPMPLNLAVFAPGRATDAITAHPAITIWAVGGHSLGGAMAARYAYLDIGTIDGLVLWAAYPASTDDLSNRQHLAALSVHATLDGLINAQERLGSKALLPAHTCWVPIEGGNHAQFGDYGAQRGDYPAAIPQAEQHAAIVDATASFLARLEIANSGASIDCAQIEGK